jgi:hypothetical protein
MKQLSTVCISIILLSGISIAQAQDSSSNSNSGAGPGMGQGRGMGHNMPTFEDFDLDKNGYLHKEEFIEARTKRISERAKEGYMMRGLSNMMEFEDIDKDADGKITPAPIAPLLTTTTSFI